MDRLDPGPVGAVGASPAPIMREALQAHGCGCEEGCVYLVRSSTTPCQQVGKGEDAQLPLTCPSRDPELSRASLEESLADRPQTPDQCVER